MDLISSHNFGTKATINTATMILDLGCGNNKAKGAIGVDISIHTQADIICDLDKFPYPFKDNQFDLVFCIDILEHLGDIVGVMDEIFRITKAGGLVKIRVPHYACYWNYSDPTHRIFFNSFSFNHFTKQRLHPQYTQSKFELIDRKIIFHTIFKILGAELFARKFTRYWEEFLSFILRPQNIVVTLKVLK